MFDDLIKTLKENAGGQLTEKLGLSADQAEKSIQTAKETVEEKKSDLMGLVSSGGGSSMMDSISEKLSGPLVKNLMDKVGLSSETASSVKGAILPFIINFVKDKLGMGSVLGGLGDDDKEKGVVDKLKDKLGGLF